MKVDIPLRGLRAVLSTDLLFTNGGTFIVKLERLVHHKILSIPNLDEFSVKFVIIQQNSLKHVEKILEVQKVENKEFEVKF
mmetsp:Transcript_18267/g.13273  ORF Transcript_18267/g.13273 Transcript_18267/m.13273 type:complete len:81 (-) Transcript_18267:101-343(-)